MRKLLCLSVGALLCVAAGARADIVPDYIGGAPIPDGANFTYTYNTEVVVDQRIDAGDFFTIYDFAGYTGVHSQPANWVLTSSNTGVDPAGTFPIDDPTVPNLTWIYDGPTVTGQADLGDFTADSSINQLGNAFFAAEGTRSSGPDTGTPILNVGTVTAPVAVPEPTAIALAIPAVLMLKRRRRA